MQKYFQFDGVSTRSEFWAVYLIAMFISIVLGAIAGVIMATAETVGIVAGIGLLMATIAAGIWVVTATGVRRCRDAGINPWWVLAGFVPYIGAIVWIVIGVLKTEKV